MPFNIYEPIFEGFGCEPITLDMIFNPYYPDHVKWRCKATRKRIKKGVRR